MNQVISSVTPDELRTIAAKIDPCNWRVRDFLFLLSNMKAVTLDWSKGKLILGSNLGYEDGTKCQMYRSNFASYLDVEFPTNEDLLCFLRHSGIQVAIINHGKSPEEIKEVMKHIDKLSHHVNIWR